MPERNRIILTGLAISVVCASGCSHVGHRANVREGVNISMMGAPSWETYDPPNRDYYRTFEPDVDFSKRGRTDYQISWGYAWRLRNERKLMPLVSFAMSSKGSSYFPSAGLYYQATSDDSPSAGGIGVIIGLDPMLYLIWGRDFVRSSEGRGKFGIDLAFGYGSGPSYMIDYRIFYQLNIISFGFFTEYRYFPGVLETCDENCDYTNYLKSRWSFGIILIHAPGKRPNYDSYP